MARLKEIFFQLRDVREDSQQRGWAVHDDLGVIMEYLSELLQILVRGGEGGREGGYVVQSCILQLWKWRDVTNATREKTL